MATTQWIDKSGTTTDIHDSRLPASLGTADQVLKMNSGATGIEWGTAGGGSTLYEHKIHFYGGSSIVYLNAYTTSATPMSDFSSLYTFLSQHTGGITSNNVKGFACTGVYYGTSYYPIISAFTWSTEANTIYVRYINGGETNDTFTSLSWIYDTVTQIS